MAGLKVVPIKVHVNGSLDLEDLKAKAETHRDKLAAFMVRLRRLSFNVRSTLVFIRLPTLLRMECLKLASRKLVKLFMTTEDRSILTVCSTSTFADMLLDQ